MTSLPRPPPAPRKALSISFPGQFQDLTPPGAYRPPFNPQIPDVPAPTCLPDELLGFALAEGADLAGLGRDRGRAQGP